MVIGGGQAGLESLISYYLTHQGRPHVVLEQAPQIAPAGRTGGGTPSTARDPYPTVRSPGFPYQGSDPGWVHAPC